MCAVPLLSSGCISPSGVLKKIRSCPTRNARKLTLEMLLYRDPQRTKTVPPVFRLPLMAVALREERPSAMVKITPELLANTPSRLLIRLFNTNLLAFISQNKPNRTIP